MPRRRGFIAPAVAGLVAALAGSQPGCGTTPGGVRAPSVTKILSPRPVVPNPVVVPSSDFENVWNKTVAVVDKYFDIESENRLSHTIRTQPQMGATMLEPWALDSTTFQDRLEASLQTIRARVGVVHVDPSAHPVGFWSKLKCTSSWRTWPSPIVRRREGPFSVMISRSIGFARSWGPSPRHWVGSNGDGTKTSSKRSSPASVTLCSCDGG